MLPFGEPQLMASFTSDDQLPSKYLEERNRKFGVDGEEVRKRREGWTAEPVDPDALL